jgi:colicin import membrane protein
MRPSNLEDALDRALAAADVTSGASWREGPLREERPAAYSHPAADAGRPLSEATHSRAAPVAARLAAASGAAAPVSNGAVGAQLDAALREVTAALRRGRIAHDGAHEPVRLLAVRAAAAGAEQRAAATAARALATRSEAVRRRAQLLDEERLAAEPGAGWHWRERARPDDAEARPPQQLAVARVEPAARHAPAGPAPASRLDSRSQAGGLAHAAGTRRLHALAVPQGAHNALLKRTARVAAAWDEDEDD